MLFFFSYFRKQKKKEQRVVLPCFSFAPFNAIFSVYYSNCKRNLQRIYRNSIQKVCRRRIRLFEMIYSRLRKKISNNFHIRVSGKSDISILKLMRSWKFVIQNFLSTVTIFAVRVLIGKRVLHQTQHPQPILSTLFDSFWERQMANKCNQFTMQNSEIAIKWQNG